MSFECSARTTHFINLALVHLLASPVFTLDLLSVVLPLAQKADDMHRVLCTAVRAEFTLDILITQDTHVVWKMLAVPTEEAAVERNRWEKSGRYGSES